MILKHEDASMKHLSLNMPKLFIESIIGKRILKCNYLPTQGLINNPRQLEMDFAVQVSNNLILNFEFQSTAPKKEDLIRFLEYALALRRKYNCLVETIIVCTADVEIKQRELKISNNTIFRPQWVMFKDMDGKEVLNIIKNKFKNNEKISGKDIINLALISLYKFEKEEYFENVLEAAELIFKLNSLSKENLDTIATVQFILVDKFFRGKERKQLGKVLKMRINLIEELVDEGKEEERRNIIQKLKSKGLTTKEISNLTDFPINTINALLKL